jgi:hypothetical protein
MIYFRRRLIMSKTTLDYGRPSAQVRGLWMKGLAAAALAVATNGALFLIAVASGIFPALTFQPDGGAQMSIEPILLVSFVGALAGVGLFALLRRWVARPTTIFLWVAAVALLISFAAPFAVPGTALLQAVALNVMHVVVAGFVVWAALGARTA